MTAIAPLLFAVIKPGAIFWTNEFFAMILCVAGADFSRYLRGSTRSRF